MRDGREMGGEWAVVSPGRLLHGVSGGGIDRVLSDCVSDWVDGLGVCVRIGAALLDARILRRGRKNGSSGSSSLWGCKVCACLLQHRNGEELLGREFVRAATTDVVLLTRKASLRDEHECFE